MRDNDERIWNEWVVNIEQAFADTASAEQAYADLTKLGIRRDQIDEYIAAFEHFTSEGGMGTRRSLNLRADQEGFAEAPSLDKITTRPYPVTINEWIAAARREVQRRRLVLASLGPRNEHPMARRDRLKEALRRPSQREPQRDLDTMDVDATILGDCVTMEHANVLEGSAKLNDASAQVLRVGRQRHLKKSLPKSSERQKERRKRASSDYEIARGERRAGRCNGGKKKRRTRSLSLRHCHLHEARPDPNDEGMRRTIGQIDGNWGGFLIPSKLRARGGREGSIMQCILDEYMRRSYLLSSKPCEM